jgi:flagellin-specific chaperone FliS
MKSISNLFTLKFEDNVFFETLEKYQQAKEQSNLEQFKRGNMDFFEITKTLKSLRDILIQQGTEPDQKENKIGSFLILQLISENYGEDIHELNENSNFFQHKMSLWLKL